MKIIKPLTLLMALLLLNACSIERRHYTRGYNLNWGNNTSEQVGKSRKNNVEKTAFNQIPSESGAIIIPESAIEVSAETDEPFLIKTQQLDQFPSENSINQDTCDHILLKNNTEILAKVLEINLDYIKYKNCNNKNGPDHILSKSDIAQITYANGLVEPFINTHSNNQTTDTTTYTESNENNSSTEPVIFPLSKHAVIAGGCSFIPVVGWVFGILAIVFGSISLSKIRNNPEQFTGEEKARTGIILGTVGLVLGAIAAMISYYYLWYY